MELKKKTKTSTLLLKASISSYSDPNEIKLESELEKCRQVRDKLGSVAEQWRNAANLLRTSAKSAIVSNEQYSLIPTST